ncbi:MAG TPA: alpha/beta hydrolase [Candidatus Dormibacteraeota bacterium]|nr:alpha/beta hydrolase [Candidatus Dormibacteraeota bacterium]
MDDPRGVSRRALLLSAGVGLGAVTVDGARKPLLAQADRPRADELWSAEYVARKGDVSLALYRKRIGPPQAGERPVLFLVHGSSVSAKPSFDLTVPGRGEYSLMNVFAGYGFDVWTMDHEGYGKSARTAGNSDVASGVEDLKAASEVVVRETGRPRAHFYGGSSGALRAAGFAMARPERIDRLILEAFTWTGKGSPTLGKRAEQVDFYRTHNRRPRGRDMIRSIFTRDKPGTSDPAVAEALADAELPFGDTIPTGTYLDMTANLPVVDPRRVKAPVLMVRGEHDGIATEDDLLEFFRRLPNPDRQFIVLAGASHAVALGLSRGQLWHVVRAFLTLPTA